MFYLGSRKKSSKIVNPEEESEKERDAISLLKPSRETEGRKRGAHISRRKSMCSQFSSFSSFSLSSLSVLPSTNSVHWLLFAGRSDGGENSRMESSTAGGNKKCDFPEKVSKPKKRPGQLIKGLSRRLFEFLLREIIWKIDLIANEI